MDVKRAWVERVLGIVLAPSDELAGAIGPDDLIARVKDVTMQAALLPEPYRAELLAESKEIEALLERGTTAEAAERVDDLEDALSEAAGASRVAEAAEGADGRVAYRRLQLQWRDAQDAARLDFDRFVESVLADPDVQEDELFDDVVDAAATAANLIPEFGDALSDVLDRLDTCADPAERDKLTSQARDLLDEYSAALDQSEGLRELQSLSDDEYGGLAFFGTLQDALRSLHAAIV